MGTKFDNARVLVERYPATYTEVCFPMVFDSASYRVGFSTPGGGPYYFQNGLALDGLTYILYRLEDHVDRDEARDLYLRDRGAFVEYVNIARKIQEQARWREIGRTLIAAEIAGSLYGLLTNYNPVSNSEVLDMVESAGLESRLSWYKFEAKEMSLYFRSKAVIDNKAAFGLAVRNGETGHVTLGYYLYVAYGDYVFTFPYAHKRRHLSRVGEAKSDLQAALESVDLIDMDTYMKNHALSEIEKCLSAKKFDKIRLMIAGRRSYPIADFVSYLFQQRSVYGLKTVVSEALDKILGAVAKEIK